MVKNNRTTAALQASDLAHHLHPFTDHAALRRDGGSRVVVRGQGCDVWDNDGNRYLDGFAGLACVSLGYGRAELAEAAFRQMQELAYQSSFFHTTHPLAIQLAEHLVD